LAVSKGSNLAGMANRLAMAAYPKKNLRSEVENQAPKFDTPSEMQARFARTALDEKTLGLSMMKLEPRLRFPFGHKHAGQEEVYVIVRGSGRIKVDAEIVDVAQ
jgi:mannose-6-phosphate isomerase-like protein (cupin superfamily)